MTGFAEGAYSAVQCMRCETGLHALAGSHQHCTQRAPTPAKQKSSPIMRVGKGVKAGVTTLQDVPQQAIGHIMGGAGGGFHSQKQFQQQAAERAGNSPLKGAAGNSPHHKDKSVSPQRQQRRVGRRRAGSVAHKDDSEGSDGSTEPNQHQLEAPATGASAANGDEQEAGQKLAGWDKVRKVVRGSATTAKPVKDSVAAALESKSPPPQGNPATRHLDHSDSSSGSLSKNTGGPLQYIYSRGGKMAAVLAMLGSMRKKQAETDDIEDTAGQAPDAAESDGGDSAEITSHGAQNHSGDDPVSRFGANSPHQAAGSQVSLNPSRSPNWLQRCSVICISSILCMHAFLACTPRIDVLLSVSLVSQRLVGVQGVRAKVW